ncbi:hypothetical protein [Eubacterium sp. MSJ-33]|uniref:hypothetical protein n=1 Tax=Eubacterium sp. MSJ-33 TaxID=2841528 RepID=UPI001C7751B4|nr:hypothetical protein [Eubacterium sp. MSJ-33]QWT53795.1 hypothetical protein KP625_04030 [Eubacterium sp. MSJ-33]
MRQRNAVASYNIGKHRFLELYHYCMQYPDWIKEIRELRGLRSHETGATGNGLSNPTASAAIKAAELSKRCKLIENTAVEANRELAQYILAGVTDTECTYPVLEARGMPASRALYYRSRRKFYYLLSKKVK